jgi:hypothetical protein
MSNKVKVHSIKKDIKTRKKNIVKELIDKKVDVLVSYLPV